PRGGDLARLPLRPDPDRQAARHRARRYAECLLDRVGPGHRRAAGAGVGPPHGQAGRAQSTDGRHLEGARPGAGRGAPALQYRPRPRRGLGASGAEGVTSARQVVDSRRITARSSWARTRGRSRLSDPTRSIALLMVRPLSWAETTRGSTYDPLATVGVLPRSSATRSITSRSIRRRSVSLPGSSAPARYRAARTVACQVRRSLTEHSSPASSLKRALMSSACTSRQS